MIQPDLTVRIPDELGHVHFIGIGGSGMSGIARMMAERGLAVSGSDRENNYSIDSLRTIGISVAIGHDARNVADADTVVVTSALWPNNPELLEARRRGLTILHRSQALAWLTRGSRLVAVAGAHGKTTSTGMLATALRRLGDDPSFVNGGIVSELGVSSDLGHGDVFVLEADESDGSFLVYDPSIALVTNIDTDHLATYGTMDAFESAFARFADGASDTVVLSADDPLSQAVRSRMHHPNVRTFGFAVGADTRLSEIDTTHGAVSAKLVIDGDDYALQLSIPGRHNAINAAGVITVLLALGYSAEAAIGAVEPFSGTKRRFDLHGVENGVSVFDDYAHHPTEVAAVLQAARTVVGSGRIIAIQQPHLYSRTKAMAPQFAEVLEQNADETVVLDVCGAREDPIPGVTGAMVADKFSDQHKVFYRPDWQQAADTVAEIAKPGDYVITLGCGDVYRIIPQVLDALHRREATQGSAV